MKKSKAMICVVCIFVSVVIVGCVAPYAPSPVQHTYITNTQDYHRLSGLSIKYDTGDPVIRAMGAVMGLSVNFSYFIDGRLVGEHNRGANFDTFIQLPPGNHQLIVQAVETFIGTAPMVHCKDTYLFDLEDNQNATLQICGECCVKPENVKKWRQR